MTSEFNAMVHFSNTNNLDLIPLNYYYYEFLEQNPKIVLAGYDNKSLKINIKEKKVANAFPVTLKKIGKHYKIGPLVGILTVSDKTGFKGNKENFIDLIEYGIKTGVLIYVITGESIDIDKRVVDGYLYLPSEKRWIKRKMPLPDVVYNRLPSRSIEKSPKIKKIVNFFRTEGIPLFNPNYFNKLILNKWMSNSKSLKHLLPETTLLKKESLSKLLSKYPMLYLKPVDGKAGVGFIRIQKKGNQYLLIYQNKKVIAKTTFKSFNCMWNKIKFFTRNKDYIVQRGIKLMTYKKSPYDIRVLVQKNEHGNWDVSGIGCRIAGRNSITTHVPRGGYILPINDVLRHSYGDSYMKWKEEITSTSINIAKHIEKSSNNMLGELSIDFGIDHNNKIWFFEANSKPMKFDEPSIRETSLLRLMQYFCHTSNFDAIGVDYEKDKSHQ